MLLTLSYHATDMAAPDAVEDIPKPSGTDENSPDEMGNDDDEYMDSCELTPYQSARTSSKHPIVTSPPGQPPPQRPKVDYSVCHRLIHPIRMLIHRLSKDVDPARRRSSSASRFH